MKEIIWPEFKFPPINLWNMPRLHYNFEEIYEESN